MAEDQGPKLSQHLAGKYEMKNGVQPGPALVKIDHGHEEVDFRTMTVDQAEALIAKGCKDIGKIAAPGKTTL
jgi:hypothetical protein